MADDQLVLTARKGNVFSNGMNEFHFVTPSTVYYIPANKDTIRYVKTAAAALTAASMKEYPGEYVSEETASSVAIRRNFDTLIIQFKPDL